MNDNLVERQDLDAAMKTLRGAMQSLATGIRNDTGIPGLCFAVNVDGYEIAVGAGTQAIDNPVEINENTHFQMGCISKLLTAMTAAELIEAGKCHQDDPIEKYLEEFRGTEPGKNLAIWHLLSHTSGYRGLNIYDPGTAYYYSWPKCVEFLKTTPQLFNPGSVFSYEHTEYVILTEIIKRITGTNILDLYHEMIFRPSGIIVGTVKAGNRGDEMYAADHTFNRDTMKYEKVRTIPFGDFWNGSLSGITMTMRDLLRITSIIGGISQVPPGMSESAVKFTHKQVIELPHTCGSSRHEQLPGSFGTGCALYRGWLLGHNGSARGQACGLRFDPHINIAMVIGINAWQPFFRDSIINGVFGMMRGRSIAPLPEKPLETPLEGLAGTYIGPQDCEIVVVCESEQITCTLYDRGTSVIRIMMRRDENGILRVFSDTQHYSLGFFKTPDSGTDALMLGTLAFCKA